MTVSGVRLIFVIVKYYKKNLWFIQILNEKRNFKKVNKEQVKILEIYRNVGQGCLTFIYMIVQTPRVNEKKVKI